MSEIRTVTCAKCHRPLMLIDFYGQQLVPSDLRLGQDVLFPLILWFLLTRQNCKVPVAANSQDQLRDTIWPEIGKWHRQLPDALKAMIDVQAERVVVVHDPEGAFAVRRTASKDNPEALQGFHATLELFAIARST